MFLLEVTTRFDDTLKTELALLSEEERNWIFRHGRKPFVVENICNQIIGVENAFGIDKEKRDMVIDGCVKMYVGQMRGWFEELTKTEAQKYAESKVDNAKEEMEAIFKEVE